MILQTFTALAFLIAVRIRTIADIKILLFIITSHKKEERANNF